MTHDPVLVLNLARVAYNQFTLNHAKTPWEDLPTHEVTNWQQIIRVVLDQIELIQRPLNPNQIVITLDGPDMLWFSSGKELTMLSSEIALNGMEERDRVVLRALCEYMTELLDNR